jgi:uncharacterized protein
MEHPIDSMMGSASAFLSNISLRLASFGIASSGLLVDHLCYRAPTYASYVYLRAFLLQEGTLLVEGMIGGRPIATYRLHEPLKSADGTITVLCLELASPALADSGKDDRCEGSEHVEIVIKEELQEFMRHHPRVPWKSKNLGTLDKEVSIDLAEVSVEGYSEKSPQLSLCIRAKFHRFSLEDKVSKEKTEGLIVPLPRNWSPDE